MSHLILTSKSRGARLMLIGLMSALFVGVMPRVQAQASDERPSLEKSPSMKSGGSSLPANAQGPISAALGKDDSG
jgi:hypothetical protein